MQNAKCKMQNVRCKMQDAKCKINFAFCILHFALHKHSAIHIDLLPSDVVGVSSQEQHRLRHLLG